MLQDWFWGAVLSKETAEYRWVPTFSEVDESSDSVDVQEDEGHFKTLELTMAVLSPDAKQGEVQEVELVTRDSREADVTVTVAVLVGGSLYQTMLNVQLPQVPATLRLKRGDGPVHIIGKEYVDKDIDPDDEQVEEEEDFEVEAEEEVTTDVPAQKIDARKRKKPETANGKSANGSAKAKRTKVDSKNGTDEDEEDEEMEDEEEAEEEENSEEEAAPARGKKAAKKGAAAAGADAAGGAAKKPLSAKKAGGSAKKGKKGAKAKA